MLKKLKPKQKKDKQASSDEVSNISSISVKAEKNWYRDRYETVTIQRNVLFVFLTVMVFSFGFFINKVVDLNNKKVYEPFIVQIEESTGVITKLDSNPVRNMTAVKAMRDSSLVKYIKAREGYNFADYQYNYYQVARLMSSNEVFKQFAAEVRPTNPDSPIKLGNDKKIEVRIKNIIELDEKQNLIQIRVAKMQTVNRSGVDGKETNFVITLRYEYKDLQLTETERYINPLGLQVIAYKIDEEVADRF